MGTGSEATPSAPFASVASNKSESVDATTDSVNAGSAARGAGGASGIVGSNKPGPSYRLTGADDSREVRRGTLVVLLPDVRGCFGETLAEVGCFSTGAGLADGVVFATGFADVFDFAIGVIRAEAGRGELKSRGERSRRSSKLHPRGRVSRDACSTQSAFKWRASSESKFSSHTTQATRSIP